MRSGVDLMSPAAEEEMHRLLNEVFDEARLPTHIDTIWRPRFAAVGAAFIKWERERARFIRRSRTEVPASMELGIADMRLTGIADRLDTMTDGSVEIIDYKTGSSPSATEARVLLDPQLALEAAALKAGAFKDVPPSHPQSLLYVRLKPGSRFKSDAVNNEGSRSKETRSADQLADESLAELRKLLSALLSGKHGFASRLIVQKERDYGGEYDHLARVAEWSTADSEEENGDEG